ncbi:MAG: prepilin-type N-terminal cleavage/methylation domain-containing protein [Deinococcota bacterium]
MIDKREQGFSLIELLVVIGIISVLVAIGIGAYRNWRDAENFRASQRTVFEAINQARSDARRESIDQTISWAGAAGNTELQVCSGTGACRTVELPYGATFEVVNGPNTEFTYTAPFGRKVATEIEWLVSSRGGDRFGKVRVYGVTGKAVFATCDADNAAAARGSDEC